MLSRYQCWYIYLEIIIVSITRTGSGSLKMGLMEKRVLMGLGKHNLINHYRLFASEMFPLQESLIFKAGQALFLVHLTKPITE